MVVNEPESNLHPNLARRACAAVRKVSNETQIFVVSHSAKLVSELKKN
ncbi:MAG: hypothetical protein U1E25_04045 [Methylocystis sp.]